MSNVRENASAVEPESQFADLALPTFRPWRDRQAEGKALRKQVPRSAHREWTPTGDRPDPLALIEASNQGRNPDLIPLRYGRMLQTPFTFFRGSALIMAADLATVPTTGIPVQACGDSHLMNFGGFASPERNLLFDLNDFDETLPAPWDWDVKRLVTSLVIAAQDMEFDAESTYQVARATVSSYRQTMRLFRRMTALETWYTQLDDESLIQHAPGSITKQHWQQMARRAYKRTLVHTFKEFVEQADGYYRFVELPPVLYRPPNYDQYFAEIRALFEQYRRTLQNNCQYLLERYQLFDVAIRVGGVGSVGTHCGVALLMADEGDPLILQYKEATASVLESHLGKSRYEHNGQRVVSGQRLMQAASDMFLGWTSNEKGQDFYFRQFRDMKTSIRLQGMRPVELENYGEICSCALARAHACSGDAAMIAGYLGKGKAFDKAVIDFGLAYAKQVHMDYQRMVDAVKAGHIETREG
ncbi:MAG: DUF2252 domain-containing protein [Kaiparowitsia implicata GSE-PSE-MK54-09C]|jgi:uncharacterized protein (DUF2252 family)|nr:DUF2252 domain-containing protein [Kaiparowitsia implicata GSE-PSE-MK54-09C]